MRAIQIHEYGGPEVLVEVDLAAPEPGPGEVLVDPAATGVNFVEIYYRSDRHRRRPSPLSCHGARRPHRPHRCAEHVITLKFN